MNPNAQSWRDRRSPGSNAPARGRGTTFTDGPFRGRFYGRGMRGRGDFVPRGQPSVPRIPGMNILSGLYPSTIEVIAQPDPVVGGDDVQIEDVQYVASYSWLDSNVPTIIVPGSPRVWRNDLAFPFTVPRDAGITFVYQNAHRFSAAPLLPLFAAADTLAAHGAPPIDWSAVDIVTDRNNLRKLWAFADGTAPPADFRVDLELAGPWTLLMQRWEERTAEHHAAHGVAGYGDGFEQMCTAPAPGCERAVFAGHHRVVSYNFAGLKMIVRCEVDACFGPEQDIMPEDTDPVVDALVGALESLDISSPPPDDGPSTETSVRSTVTTNEAGGIDAPPSTIIEASTSLPSTEGVKKEDTDKDESKEEEAKEEHAKEDDTKAEDTKKNTREEITQTEDSEDGESRADSVAQPTHGASTLPAADTPATANYHGLAVQSGGAAVPQDSIIKVKSRSARSMAQLRWYEVYPQLLLGQTPHCMLGVHHGGTFAEVRHVQLRAPDSALRGVADAVQPGLRRLRALLEEIQSAVMARGKGCKMSLVCREGTLTLMKRTNQASILPEEVLERFES